MSQRVTVWQQKMLLFRMLKLGWSLPYAAAHGEAPRVIGLPHGGNSRPFALGKMFENTVRLNRLKPTWLPAEQPGAVGTASPAQCKDLNPCGVGTVTNSACCETGGSSHQPWVQHVVLGSRNQARRSTWVLCSSCVVVPLGRRGPVGSKTAGLDAGWIRGDLGLGWFCCVTERCGEAGNEKSSTEHIDTVSLNAM